METINALQLSSQGQFCEHLSERNSLGGKVVDKYERAGLYIS